MKLLPIVALFVVPFSVSSVRVTLDDVYSQASNSLSGVACSDGANGLLTKGYKTFGDLPDFPHLGGSSDVSWNSPECGSCWEIYYNYSTVLVTMIDHVSNGVNLPLEAMNKLTNGNAGKGSIEGATKTLIARTPCIRPRI